MKNKGNNPKNQKTDSKPVPNNHDIYDMPQRIACATARIKDDKDISQKNKDYILGYDRYLGLRQTSQPYRERTLNLLHKITNLCSKDFDKHTREDAEAIVEAILSGSQGGKEQQCQLLQTYKRIQAWILKVPKVDQLPEHLRWIQAQKPRNPVLNPQDFVSLEEVKRMADSSKILRDRAFVKVLWESGCRISEFLTLRLRDIEEVEDGCFLLLQTSKTKDSGGLRKIFVFYFWSDLKEWLQKHPHNGNMDAPLWCSLADDERIRSERLDYFCAYRIVKKGFIRCNIKRRFTSPHSLRHSSVSWFLRNSDLSMADLCYKYWGCAYSKMITRYGHIDVESYRSKITGKYKAAKQNPIPQQCPRCGTMNDGLSTSCMNKDCQTTLKVGIEQNHNKLLLIAVKAWSDLLKNNPEKAEELGLIQANEVSE